VSRLADSGGTLTKDVIVGTPGYMSPEQAGGLSTTHQSDLFSFGAVVYRALTGEPPFAGPDTPQTLYQVVYRNPQRPSALIPGLPPDVDLVLATAMAKDPADRFETALDMANAMRLAVKSALDPRRRLHARTVLAALPWGIGARDSAEDFDEISLTDAEAIELP
jgi:serine/threonine-protein kinase